VVEIYSNIVQMSRRYGIYEVNKSELQVNEFASDVDAGLTSSRKSLKSKYFYDKTGSYLFEQICLQPEYYVTRLEADILTERSLDIANACQGQVSVVELGSGSSCKTRILFEHILERQGFLYYFPIDVSHSILIESVQKLSSDFPNLYSVAISSDYAEGIDKATDFITKRYHVPCRKLVLFLGSSIGNFDLHEARSFLSMLMEKMEKKDLLLIGFDLQKKSTILNAAYNDQAGMTARFNLNLLSRINRELGGEFDVKKFDHHAFYNEDMKRVEMHLISTADQQIYIKSIGKSFNFREGESIHTENSYKYSLEQIRDLADYCGFEVKTNLVDEKKWFNLALLSPMD
jgi:dimethylhistidine N-methyltransferase